MPLLILTFLVAFFFDINFLIKGLNTSFNMPLQRKIFQKKEPFLIKGSFGINNFLQVKSFLEVLALRECVPKKKCMTPCDSSLRVCFLNRQD